MGKLGKGEWEIQASGNGVSKSWEWRAQHRDYSQDTVPVMDDG